MARVSKGTMARIVVRSLAHALERFYRENTFSKAASLAYTTLLSLLPLTALLFGMLASFAVSPTFISEVRNVIFRQFLPNTSGVDMVIEYLTKVSSLSSHPSFGVTMGVTLVVTSILLLNSIEGALNEVWQVFIPRSLAGRLTAFCTMLLLVPLVLVSGVYFIKTQAGSGVPGLKPMLPVLIDTAAFFSIFFFVPAAPIRAFPALVGSAVSAVLFLGAKKAFAFYVEQFASYDVVYGAISSIPIFLLWLYVTWVIVLFGCEVAYQVQCAGSAAAVAPRSVVTVGVFADHIARAVIEAMKKRFDAGEAPYTEYELAQEFGMSHVVLRPVLRSLVAKGLLCQAGEKLTFGINPQSTSP